MLGCVLIFVSPFLHKPLRDRYLPQVKPPPARQQGPRVDVEGVEQRFGTGPWPYTMDRVEGGLAFYFTTLVFTNTASSGNLAARAVNTTATIEISELGGDRIARSHGRWCCHEWSEHPIAAPSTEGDPPKSITMEPDGAQHRLDVLVGTIFVGGDQPSRWHGLYLVRQPRPATLVQSVIPPGEFDLLITLRSTTMQPVVFKYRLSVPSPEGRETEVLQPELSRC